MRIHRGHFSGMSHESIPARCRMAMTKSCALMFAASFIVLTVVLWIWGILARLVLEKWRDCQRKKIQEKLQEYNFG